MDMDQLIPISSLENAWARLSSNSEYQRCISMFFKAPSFYIGCSGLYAGRRAVYCDRQCCQRLSAELTNRVAELGEQAPHVEVRAENVEDVQILQLQSEAEVKTLFKDFKRAARYQKQCRQLAAARALLANVRHWTAPFQPLPPVAAVAPVMGMTQSLTATANSATLGDGNGYSKEAEALAIGPTYSPVQGDGACRNGVFQEYQDKPVPRSHPISRDSSMSSQSEDCETSSGNGHIRDDCASGTLGHHCTVAVAVRATGGLPGSAEAAEPVGHGRHLEDAALTPGPAASGYIPATVCAGETAAPGLADMRNAEQPVLRPLRTAVECADRWISDGATLHLTGMAASPPASCSSSVLPSCAATPLWLPATPRYALPMPSGSDAATAAAVAASLTCGVERDSHCPGSPAPEWRSGGNGTLGMQAVVTAAAAERDLGPRDITGACTYGGGAEGVLVVCCSIDLEWWERDNSKVTEVGWTMWDNLTRQLESRHHIVAENEALVNRIHVPDHKHDFLFGSSEKGSLAEGAAALQSDLDHYGERAWEKWWAQHHPQPRQQALSQQRLKRLENRQQEASQQCGREEKGEGQDATAPTSDEMGTSGRVAKDCLGQLARHADAVTTASEADEASTVPARGMTAHPPPPPRIQLVVVGHGLSQDLKALSSLLGVTIPAAAAIVDTADLAWAALEAAPGHERTAMSLRVLLKMLDIPASKLHNGGNDARYTLEAMLTLATLERNN
ncbi:hypothetical protein Vretifemale_3106 [Volvox reticuliferus]|uniref:Gfd2/YDR514C-like C-terminal domain-containing protein n=1 Tax=Volvox reticuliferus TaxID=1737510 RepID=A0A8J4FFP1_9CHLO|nr:hypothetical protein Vretifemale_3106 [Volvox reticuliferus]